MFNLIMLLGDWHNGRETMPIVRMFEYTEGHISARFKEGANLNLAGLLKLPCLFMKEGSGDEIARVGHIIDARVVGGEIAFEYAFDVDVPPLQNSTIYASRAELDMPLDWEFSRNHWAVKEVDLYRFLLRNVRPRRQRPTVFQIPEHENVECTLVSAMMPFEAAFAQVYESIRQAADNVQLRCRRADDIWENPAII